jgi:hypothetical protein
MNDTPDHYWLKAGMQVYILGETYVQDGQLCQHGEAGTVDIDPNNWRAVENFPWPHTVVNVYIGTTSSYVDLSKIAFGQPGCVSLSN